MIQYVPGHCSSIGCLIFPGSTGNSSRRTLMAIDTVSRKFFENNHGPIYRRIIQYIRHTLYTGLTCNHRIFPLPFTVNINHTLFCFFVNLLYTIVRAHDTDTDNEPYAGPSNATSTYTEIITVLFRVTNWYYRLHGCTVYIRMRVLYPYEVRLN